MAGAQPRKAKYFLLSAVRAAGLLKFADACKFALNQVKYTTALPV